ncbi:MAG: hypothetical protein E7653_04315 [Ruminococcaceae bacterium]|nr:hypothetical protein [Oscillospiraceae bacterium]
MSHKQLSCRCVFVSNQYFCCCFHFYPPYYFLNNHILPYFGKYCKSFTKISNCQARQKIVVKNGNNIQNAEKKRTAALTKNATALYFS